MSALLSPILAPKLPEHPRCPGLLALGPCLARGERKQLASRFCFTQHCCHVLQPFGRRGSRPYLSTAMYGNKDVALVSPITEGMKNEAPSCHSPERCSSSSPNQYFQPEIFGLQVFGFLMNSPNFLQKADTFFFFFWRKYSQKIQFSL